MLSQTAKWKHFDLWIAKHLTVELRIAIYSGWVFVGLYSNGLLPINVDGSVVES